MEPLRHVNNLKLMSLVTDQVRASGKACIWKVSSSNLGYDTNYPD
jgi:hypothetical protein